MADHPAWDKGPHYERPHGALLPARFERPVRFVRIHERMVDVPRGKLAVMCIHRDCRAVHEFEYTDEAT